MNKQEVMKILTDTKHDYEFCWSDDFRTGFIEGVNCSLKAINQLNEPEKPTLTKEEAEWFEGLKEAHSKLPKIQLIYFIVRQGWGYLFEYKEGYEEANHVLKPQLYPDEVYPPDLKERLLNAALYGYEVEKEKLYTVFQLATKGYLFRFHTDVLESLKVSKKHAQKIKDYHFTQAELEELQYWDNPAFEIEEVEE